MSYAQFFTVHLSTVSEIIRLAEDRAAVTPAVQEWPSAAGLAESSQVIALREQIAMLSADEAREVMLLADLGKTGTGNMTIADVMYVNRLQVEKMSDQFLRQKLVGLSGLATHLKSGIAVLATAI